MINAYLEDGVQYYKKINGSLDDIKIYNISLNATDINYIYKSSNHYNPNVIPVFYIHGIAGNNIWDIQNTSLFERMMKYINDSGYTSITLTQLKNLTKNQISINKPIVLISDDGDKSLIQNRSTYEKFGIKFNHAIITRTGYADSGATGTNMNWSDIKNLS
jgi:hypothetical protein